MLFRARWCAATQRLLCRVVAGVVVSGVSLAAEPAPTPHSVALEYQAADGCPDAAFFAREVRSRTSQVAFTQGSEVSRSFKVVVQSTPGSYSGFLGVADARGPLSERRFEAAKCEDVIVALALVAALAVDPNASAAPADSAKAEEATPAKRSEVGEPAKPAPAPVAGPQIFDRRPPPARARPWIWSSGPAIGVLTATTTAPLLSIGWSVEVEEKRSGFAPGARLMPFFAETGTTGPSGDSAEFRLIAARAEGCALALPLSRGVRVRPCLGVDTGVLQARGVGAERPRSNEAFWLSVVLDLRLQLTVMNRFFVEVAGGPVIPVTRPTFVFERPLLVVHEVPWLAAHAGLAAAGTQF
jgi:hypothetical protein